MQKERHTKRFILPEEEIPRKWYNIQAEMPNKPLPPIHPATKQPLKAEDLCRQEPYALEEALGTSAHIYFKNESVSPMGSHKLNSAIPQAYYCKNKV